MHSRFAELDWAATRIGEISLRRRLEPTTRTEVYEVKLGDEYLMSSLFTVAEEELSRLPLGALPPAAAARQPGGPARRAARRTTGGRAGFWTESRAGRWTVCRAGRWTGGSAGRA